MKTAVSITIVLAIVLTCGYAFPQQLPDFRVKDIYLDSMCYVSVEVENIGGSVESPVFMGSLTVLVENRTIGAFQLDALKNARSSHTYKTSRNGYLSPGVHTVVAKITSNIEEASLMNNTLSKTLACNRVLPDLIVSDIWAEKLSDGRCKIMAMIKNIGGRWPGAPHTYGLNFLPVLFKIHGTPTGVAVSGHGLGELSVAGGRTIVSPLEPYCFMGKTETAVVTVMVDRECESCPREGFVLESNENNNTLTKTLSCASARMRPVIKRIEKMPPVMKVTPGDKLRPKLPSGGLYKKR